MQQALASPEVPATLTPVSDGTRKRLAELAARWAIDPARDLVKLGV